MVVLYGDKSTLKRSVGNLDFIGKILKVPFEKRQQTAMFKKEMKQGKISLYDNEIIALLKNQPMFYFQTAADFMLLKDTLGRPAQHIATNVMALVLSDHVKKMHLVEADLNPIYPDLDENGVELDYRGRSYLEVVFFDDEEESKEPEDLKSDVIEAEQFLEEMETEQWYIIDTTLGLIFEKNLYLRLEEPEVKFILSGDPLRGIINDTRELIKPDPRHKPGQLLSVMCGIGRMIKSYPKYKYRDLLFQRLLELQETLIQRAET